MRNLKWLIVPCLLIFSGCCFFKRAPTVSPVPEVKTITNTVIQQVKVNDWLVTGSILVMGISIFGFLNGWKQGVNAVIAAAVVLGVSLILKAYGGVLIFIGATGIAGFVGWQIWIRVRAFKNVVQGGEKFKKELSALVQNGLILKTLTTDEIANKITEGFNEAHRAIQNLSPVTKSLVANIRKKL